MNQAEIYRRDSAEPNRPALRRLAAECDAARWERLRAEQAELFRLDNGQAVER